MNAVILMSLMIVFIYPASVFAEVETEYDPSFFDGIAANNIEKYSHSNFLTPGQYDLIIVLNGEKKGTYKFNIIGQK